MHATEHRTKTLLAEHLAEALTRLLRDVSHKMPAAEALRAAGLHERQGINPRDFLAVVYPTANLATIARYANEHEHGHQVLGPFKLREHAYLVLINLAPVRAYHAACIATPPGVRPLRDPHEHEAGRRLVASTVRPPG